MAALDRPALFENRVSYRLLDLTVTETTAAMTYGPARYFDGINVGEAVAHELAETGPGPGPLRSCVGDPTDLRRRAVLPALSVLTLRLEKSSGSATFVMHWRDPAHVAHGGGLYQVMPVGVFQPSADGEAALTADFDLWRCMVREYSEEFLGGSEDYGDGSTPFDYETWPLHTLLTDARQNGLVRTYYLGMGVDPLSFATDILIVTVIDSEVFDAAFAGGLVSENTEGTVATFPFDDRTVTRFVHNEPMQAAGAAVLTLAWHERADLLRH
jgi:hypothetical protein